ncbi:HAD hydrolase-like protein [Microcoleus sp. FACHB-53]|nr:HAD hydrolase-like protein [Microcoleus sp. FACHB-53]
MAENYLIFDFDGVILDSWEATLEAHYRLQTELTKAQIKDKLLNDRLVKPRYTSDKKYTPEQLKELMEFRKREYDIKAEVGLKLFRGFVGELKKLKNVKMAIVSTAYQPVLEQFAGEAGLNFDFIHGFSENFSKVKSIKRIAEDWGTDLNELYFFTDTIRDIIEVKNILNPNRIIGCGWGFHGYQRLKEVLPEEQILQNFKDVHKVLD